MAGGTVLFVTAAPVAWLAGFLMDTFQAVAECGWRMVRGKR